MPSSFSRTLRFIGLSLVGVTLTGCVSQDQYNALKLNHDRLAEQLVAAQSESRQANAAAAMAKQQFDAIAGAGQTGTALIANLQSQVMDLTKDNADLKNRLGDALSHAGGQALPAPLTDALNTFAQQNPDLVDFDSVRGIVKFKSDVTFNLGEATVQAKAKDVIDRFAKILTSPAASGYELQVAGHTDNIPVSSSAVKAAGHKDNWYLSVHRAIAVSTELQKTGVSAARIGVVGYADQRPVASNASTAGQAQNRRVEVLILPTTVHSSATVAATGHHETARPAGSKLTKDSGPVTPVEPIKPVLNK